MLQAFLHTAENIPIPESDNLIPFALQELISLLIPFPCLAFAVMTPVHLHDQLHLQRQKIHDVRPYGDLPPELDPQATASQSPP